MFLKKVTPPTHCVDLHSFFPKPLVFVIATVLAGQVMAAESNSVETIIVQGKQMDLDLRAEQALTPGGVTLVDGEELYQRSVANLADMLRYVPGVWAASGSTGDSSFLSIRGSNLDAISYAGNGVKLLQDGLPVTAADGNNHNRQVDPLSIRHAVVARGANALTYGASTLGGAINFISPTARDAAPVDLFLGGGSHGHRQARLTAGSVMGNFDGLISAEVRQWDGYREHHNQDRKGLYANTGWQFNDSVKTRLYLTYIDNQQELPGALTIQQWQEDPRQAQASAVAGHFQLNVETWRAASKTEWDIDENSSLTVGFSYEVQDLYHPIVYSPFFSLAIDTEQRNAGASLRYNLRLGDHDVLVGLDYGRTWVEGGNYSHQAGRRENQIAQVDNNADSLELFLMDRWQFAPQWTLVYGVQGVLGSREVSNIAVPSGELYNPKRYYSSINPRAGLIYQLSPDAEIFANLSKLYEAPTTYDLQDDACECGDALDAMRGTVVEVGTRGGQALGAASAWHWDVALYYAQLKDGIYSKDNSRASGTSLSTNVDSTVHAGIEAMVGANFALDAQQVHRIEPLINITVNAFSFDGDAVYGNNTLPAAPSHVVRGEILYRNTNGFFAGPTFDWVGKRYADFSNNYSVEAYELLGLRIGITRKSLEVFGEVRNLTDRDYISLFRVRDSATPGDAIFTPGEPRSAYVGLKWRF